MHRQHLLEEEVAATGANLLVILTHEDLTESTVNTAQAIDLFTKGNGRTVKLVRSKIVTAFEDASDAALNTTTLIVGDSGDDDRLLASQELNENGTEVEIKEGTGTTHAPTSDTTYQATFGSMSGKKLSDIDTGEVHLFFNLQ